jgi:hypothetical protein
MIVETIKIVTGALRTQLINYADLSYAKDSGYEDEDVEDLIQKNRFPFFNIYAEGEEITKVENVGFENMERHIINMVIQFASKSMKLKEAKTGTHGLYNFKNDIWKAIRSDKTLGGNVLGFLPPANIIIDIMQTGEEKFFIAGAEMRIKFVKDLAI